MTEAAELEAAMAAVTAAEATEGAAMATATPGELRHWSPAPAAASAAIVH